MTALPALVSTSLRGHVVAQLRSEAAAAGYQVCRVVRARGRRGGAREALLAELLEADVTVVVVEAITALHPIPAKALEVLAGLLEVGIRAISLSEAWASSADAKTLHAVANYLSGVEAKRNSKRGREVIAEIRRAGNKKVGRPKKSCDVERARALVEAHGYRKAASMLGNISASSIRRALLQASPTGGAP